MSTNTTKTRQTASKQILKKLMSRSQLEALRHKLPVEYKTISEGIYAEMSKITPNLFLTGIFGLSKENFETNRISYVVNVTYESPILELNGVVSERVLVDDDCAEDMSEHFDRVSDKIQKVSKTGGNTVVHCVAGVSRSTALVLAYLVKYNDMPLKDAFKRVHQRRNVIKPNIAFFEQLVKFEKLIRGSNSCQIKKVLSGGVTVTVPDFWITEFPALVALDVFTQQQNTRQASHALLSTTAVNSGQKSSNNPHSSIENLNQGMPFVDNKKNSNTKQKKS